MSETKWTLGPWTLSARLSASENHHGWRVGTTKYSIAEVYPLGSDPSEEGIANARLIAAAPELYAALEVMICGTCVNRIGWNGPKSDMASHDWKGCIGCLKARTVLAKARGESR